MYPFSSYGYGYGYGGFPNYVMEIYMEVIMADTWNYYGYYVVIMAAVYGLWQWVLFRIFFPRRQNALWKTGKAK